MKNRIKNLLIVTIIGSIIGTSTMYAQNRGNNFAFQGLGNIEETSAAALGMGGAYTSIYGTIDALGYNSAGLNGIKKFQLSISGGSVSRQWSENQEYNPNRLFVTMPFYLEGLYVPDPADNGKMDYEVFYDGLLDTSYNVALPDTGLEYWSDEAADWIKEKTSSGLTNLSLALPFTMLNKNMVIAASWNKKLNLFNYDRNDTYLDPHLGYTEYNMPEKVDGTDTVQVNWYQFEHYRHGSMQEYKTALAVDLTKRIKVGAAVTYLSGETKDYQMLDKVGWFKLANTNRYSFSYDTLMISTSGTSKFTGVKPEVGMQIWFDRFSIGANINLPYTITRKYDYDVLTIDTASTSTTNLKYSEKFKVPFSYTLGFSLKPTDKFLASLDYSVNRYSQAEWEIANNDTTHRDWVDQKILRFGFEYTPYTFLALRFGYRSLPQVWVPDGAAYRDRGPEARAWTGGLGFDLGSFGAINMAYEYRLLKYRDIYYSNTNYCKEISQNIKISYTYSF